MHNYYSMFVYFFSQELLVSSKSSNSNLKSTNNVRVTDLETKLMEAQKTVKKLTENVKLVSTN